MSGLKRPTYTSPYENTEGNDSLHKRPRIERPSAAPQSRAPAERITEWISKAQNSAQKPYVSMYPAYAPGSRPSSSSATPSFNTASVQAAMYPQYDSDTSFGRPAPEPHSSASAASYSNSDAPKTLDDSAVAASADISVGVPPYLHESLYRLRDSFPTAPLEVIKAALIVSGSNSARELERFGYRRKGDEKEVAQQMAVAPAQVLYGKTGTSSTGLVGGCPPGYNSPYLSDNNASAKDDAPSSGTALHGLLGFAPAQHASAPFTSAQSPQVIESHGRAGMTPTISASHNRDTLDAGDGSFRQAYQVLQASIAAAKSGQSSVSNPTLPWKDKFVASNGTSSKPVNPSYNTLNDASSRSVLATPNSTHGTFHQLTNSHSASNAASSKPIGRLPLEKQSGAAVMSSTPILPPQKYASTPMTAAAQLQKIQDEKDRWTPKPGKTIVQVLVEPNKVFWLEKKPTIAKNAAKMNIAPEYAAESYQTKQTKMSNNVIDLTDDAEEPSVHQQAMQQGWWTEAEASLKPWINNHGHVQNQNTYAYVSPHFQNPRSQQPAFQQPKPVVYIPKVMALTQVALENLDSRLIKFYLNQLDVVCQEMKVVENERRTVRGTKKERDEAKIQSTWTPQQAQEHKDTLRRSATLVQSLKAGITQYMLNKYASPVRTISLQIKMTNKAKPSCRAQRSPLQVYS